MLGLLHVDGAHSGDRSFFPTTQVQHGVKVVFDDQSLIETRQERLHQVLQRDPCMQKKQLPVLFIEGPERRKSEPLA